MLVLHLGAYLLDHSIYIRSALGGTMNIFQKTCFNLCFHQSVWVLMALKTCCLSPFSPSEFYDHNCGFNLHVPDDEW